jgi:hypothetical protein
VDHPEAGVVVRSRGQVLATILVLLVVIGGAVYAEREVGANGLAAGPPGTAPSGAWFCPHGGGPGWGVTIELANPGAQPVHVRLTRMGGGKPTIAADVALQPGASDSIPVIAQDRGSGTLVEYFGGFVAAGWVAHAGSDASGVAAEPCAPSAGDRWLLPDASTLESDRAYVVVMNPFATTAVFSLTIYTDKQEPIRTEIWTDVALKPFRVQAFLLNKKALGYDAVSTVVDASVGRIAASSLDLTTTGGIRSSLGYLGRAPSTVVLPAGFDQGRTVLSVLSASPERIALAGTLLEHDASQPVAGLADSSPPGESARSFPATTNGPSAIVVTAQGEGVAVARRTFGIASDQGSTIGAVPSAAWVVLPTTAGSPNHPGLVLANPGTEPARLTLTYLPGQDEGPVPDPVTVTVPPGRAIQGPKDFVAAAPGSAILAVASSGSFVPAGASYSFGREGYATYAVALGVPIPHAWIPT